MGDLMGDLRQRAWGPNWGYLDYKLTVYPQLGHPLGLQLGHQSGNVIQVVSVPSPNLPDSSQFPHKPLA